jgi:hypothetical protein
MQPVRKADNLSNIVCRLSRNLGTLTSWNPLGHSRPVMGLLLYILYGAYIQTSFSIYVIKTGVWIRPSFKPRCGLPVHSSLFLLSFKVLNGSKAHVGYF